MVVRGEGNWADSLVVEGVGSLSSEKADEKSVGCEKIGCPKPGLCK